MIDGIMAVFVFVVAMVISGLVYPVALDYAKRHNIVDNPDARKLQRVPVPVLGGLVVYMGILCGCLVIQSFVNQSYIWWGLMGMTVMLVIGMWDDMKMLSAKFRLLIEFLLVGAFMWQTGIYFDDLHGLWGIHQLDPWVAIAFSLVLGVGLINVMNLIDGGLFEWLWDAGERLLCHVVLERVEQCPGKYGTDYVRSPAAVLHAQRVRHTIEDVYR